MMFSRNSRRGDLSPAQFQLRVAILGGFALVILSADLLPPLVPRGALRRPLPHRGQQQPGARDQGAGAARRHHRPRRQGARRQPDGPRAPGASPPSSRGREKAREAVLRRVAEISGMDVDGIEKEIRQQTKESPASPVTLQRDVPYDLVYYLREHQGKFPGVTVDRVFVRSYPQGTLGAHLFGYVREVNAEQLEEPEYQSLAPGDQVGQAGVEATYDNLLRGVNGPTRVQVDASGSPTGRAPQRAGAADRQQPASDARHEDPGGRRRRGLELRRCPGRSSRWTSTTARSSAMGSVPDLRSRGLHAARVPQAVDRLDLDGTAGTEAPIFNRAIQGDYPTGSTFKLITATAALEEGLITPTRSSTTAARSRSAASSSRTRATWSTGRSTCARRSRSRPTSTSTPRPRGRDGGRHDPGLGREPRPRQPDRHRSPGRGRGPGARPRSGATSSTASSSPTARGRSATTSTSRSARATCRRPRSSSRSPTRPSPTAAPSCARTSALQVEDPAGRVVQEIDPAPQSQVDIEPENAQRDPRRPPRGRDGAERYLVPDLRRLPGRYRRQDGYRGARRERRGPVLVRGAGAVPGPRGRRGRHDRARGLRRRRRGAGREQILTEYFDVKPNEIEDVSDAGATVYE